MDLLKTLLIGIDAKDGMVAVNGWLETSSITAIDLGRELAVDTDKCIELRLALLEIVILFAPGADRQDKDGRRHCTDDCERSDASEERDLGSARETFVNRNRSSDVAQTR